MSGHLVTTNGNFRGVQSPKKLGGDLDDSIWVDCEFIECDLSGIIISHAVFSGCRFCDTAFYSAWVFQAKFIDCKFDNCDLAGDFIQAIFVRCRFEKCDFGHADLDGVAKWEGAEAYECVVSDGSLPIVP